LEPAAYHVVHEVEESHWFCVGRRRIIGGLLDRLTEGVEHPRILDVGCGTGATMGFLEQFGEVTGIDVSPLAVDYCRQQGRVRLCLADGESLPFADESFHLVAALDLLEHLEHESKGLSEAWRVLKDGGHALLVVPAFDFLWSDFDRFSGHYRRYSKEELRRAIEGSGFQVSRLSYFNTILLPLVWGVRKFKNWAGRWHTFRSDLEMPVSGLNGLLSRIFSLESGLLTVGDLPFGVSLVCVATKRSA
jgi:ubiquinone/menaquinone biosynthesis C-methylase UbiE